MHHSIFLLLDVVPPHTTPAEEERRIYETQQLINTYTGHIHPTINLIQQRIHPDPTTYVGKGKVQEICTMVKKSHIKYVVISDIVKPGQIHDLKKELQKAYFEVEVWDRVDLILQIFKKHARTAEARLQIELAAMRHMGPRIYGMGMILSRQGGGVGGRGIGETNTELMKRHWRAQIRATEQKLKKLSADRMQRLQRRKEQGLPTIAIVGYTNAGKSSLFNLLTGKHKLEKDALFATLDSSLGKLKIHHRFITSPRSEILVSDTIGFIADLPPQLIQAFRSTLLETIHADLILHVIDSSDPLILDKIKIVDETLRDLGAIAIRQIRALNKIDLPPRASVSTIQSIAAQPDTYLISTKDGGLFTKKFELIFKGSAASAPTHSQRHLHARLSASLMFRARDFCSAPPSISF